MKINIDIDDKYEDTSITIKANKWTKELEEIIAIAKRENQERLFGFLDDQTILLEPETIDFIYAEQRKVYAAIKKQRVEVKMKLYEIEEVLSPYHFMRFSKSVIGNLKQIERFELSFSGNLVVFFHSGNKEYISRKYVTKIKEKLQLGGIK